jgi:carbon monoxide dehydrogenase subunit G
MYTAEASVNVSANPETTWAYVSNYQNFDKIMSNVKEVKMLSSETSEWHMAGPLGIPVSWKAITTANDAPSRLAWQSTEGSLETNGFITVEPQSGGSRVTVHVEYVPPLGAVGEAVANIFKDPQKMLEHDLSQLDTLISGTAASDSTPGSMSGGLTGMDNFDRVAERGEKVSDLNDSPAPGGMAGYGVTERSGRSDLDPDTILDSEIARKPR